MGITDTVPLTGWWGNGEGDRVSHTDLNRQAMELARRVRAEFGERPTDADIFNLCNGDDVLASAVRRRLDAESSGTIVGGSSSESATIESSTGSGSSDDSAPRSSADLLAEDKIGQFRIVRVLGEGGMGVVYEAEQASPKRRVALKVIRGGHVSARVRRRFEVESAVLARLQHPGIAAVYEAGISGDGRWATPYFAMELVEGTSLSDFGAKLDVRGRVELVARVCDAVQHAHTKGVIHRDLKPANILVSATGHPKVLDFGVARVADADDQGASLATEAGQIVGTIAYMSPEQVAGDSNEVDTRADVYALGVILYELLTGAMPVEVRGTTVVEAARRIAEIRPAPIGARDRRLKGDLQTIVAKALEKDRERRYQSAGDLGADLRRWLANEPIQARKASAGYLILKFAQRHTELVVAGALAVLLLIGGIIGTSIGMAHAMTQRTRADREARRATAVNEFLVTRMLGAANPEEAQGREVTVREVLDKATGEIDEAFPDDPGLRSDLRVTVSKTYLALGDVDTAIANAQAAVDLSEKETGPDSETTLLAVNNLAGAVTRAARWPEAEAMFRRVADGFEKHGGPDRRERLSAISNLAAIVNNLGRLEESEKLQREALAGLDRTIGPDGPDALAAATNLAYLLHDMGKLDEAITLYERVAHTRERLLGPKHPRTLLALSNLATGYWGAGRKEEAGEITLRVLDIRREVLGDAHPDTMVSMSNAGFILENSGQLDEAESMYRRGYDGIVAALGKDHPQALALMANLASVLAREEKRDEAERTYREALAGYERTVGSRHLEALTTRADMAKWLTAWGRGAEAETELGSVVRDRTEVLGPDHPDTLTARKLLVDALIAQHKCDDARAVGQGLPEAIDAVAGKETETAKAIRAALDACKSTD